MKAALCLKIRDWPEIDRTLWESARQRRGFLVDSAPAEHWSSSRIRISEQAYGQWLAFLLNRSALDIKAQPADRITPESLHRFIEELAARVAPWSAAMMVQAFQRVLVCIAPEHNWDWVRKIVSNMKINADRQRDRRPHMVAPEQLYSLGVQLLREASEEARKGRYSAATKARDGLIIALLISCPVRIKNLKAMEIGRHLIFEAGQYRIKFSEEETKTVRAIDLELPHSLTHWVDAYLHAHRRALLARAGGQESKSLWIDRWGMPMREESMRAQIEKRTLTRFGRHIWPHLFRSIAVTGFVDCAPELAMLAPDLLGHSNIATTEKYYILSTSAQAHVKVQSSFQQRRAEAAARLRHRETSLKTTQ